MSARKRTKRDSAENLYRQCQLGGDCPPDVRDKIEGTTWADTLLKWFAGFLYTGTLGIGTGKGGGGPSGYIPVGGRGVTTEIGGGTRVTRPTFPVEPIGPLRPTIIEESIIDTPITVDVTPEDPSVFQPGPADPGTVPSTEDIELEILDPTDNVVTESRPTLDLPTTGVDAVDVTETSFTEIPARPPENVRVSLSTFDSSAYTAALPRAEGQAFESPLVFDSTIGGTEIGTGAVENIEMDILDGDYDDIDLSEPLTSTPRETPRPSSSRRTFRSFYYRYFRQIQTGSRSFLRPDVGSEYVYENPAFEDDFETPASAPDLAPVPESTDRPEQVAARNLSEARFEKVPSGRLQVGRLGQQFGLTTRSGTQYGQYVHFFNELSTIEELNHSTAIELSDFTSAAPVSSAEVDTVIDLVSHATSELSSLMPAEPMDIDDTNLEDIEDNISFDSSRLRLINETEDLQNIDNSVFDLDSPKKYFAADHDYNLTNLSHGKKGYPVKIPFTPLGPSTVIIVDEGFTYYNVLDPSLHRKKRKRVFSS